MSNITINHISYSYQEQSLALDDINITINPGCFYGIIGPNGSGKTTLLKNISGYLTPISGEVLIGKRNVQSFSAKEIARTMALVQQQFSLEYDFSVLDIVITGRNPHLKRLTGETEADYQIAADAMARAGITHLKDRMITTLSGGEWQRMILARALCQQASIMLLDEPVTGLDIKHQVSFLKTAKALATESSISVVCVLHDLNLAKAYCDEIALLSSGKLFTKGTPEQVLTLKNLETVYDTKITIIEKNNTTYILPRY